MARKWGLAALATLVVACAPAAVEAGEPVDVARLLKIIEDQNAKIAALTQRVSGLEAKQVAVDAAIREEMAKSEGLAARMDKMPAAAPGIAKLASWAEKVKFSGDLRYRHEFFDRPGRRDRSRHRIRARLQMHAKPSEDLDVVFRLASGSSPDPVSTNQTLTDAFSSKNLWLDLAYFDWHPETLGGLHILGGKMKNPFVPPGGSDLMWDGDLNPEGLGLAYSAALSETAKVFARGGGFWVGENSGGADNLLYAAQAGIEADVADGVTLTVGGSYFDYTNIEGQTVFFDAEDSFGNTAVANDAGELDYAEDFRIVEAFAALSLDAGGTPLTLYGDYVRNLAADGDADTGWLAGVKFGKAKKPGTWELFYNYRRLEADAVVGALSDSDSWGGGTDGRGHKFGGAIAVSKTAKIAAALFLNDVGLDEKEDYKRLQVDFSLKF